MCHIFKENPIYELDTQYQVLMIHIAIDTIPSSKYVCVRDRVG